MLTRGVALAKSEPYRFNERYPVRGVHSEAINHGNGTSFEVTHASSRARYAVQTRAFNDCVAFRFLVFGEGQRIPDEATTFKIPAGSTVWFHDFEGHYEGVHQKREISVVKEGEWAAPPLTIKLPKENGYASMSPIETFGNADFTPATYVATRSAVGSSAGPPHTRARPETNGSSCAI